MNISTNPYQTGVANDPKLQQNDTSFQIELAKREEQMAKAPKILPYPIDNINSILSGVFVSLLQIREIVKQAGNNPNICKEKLGLIEAKIDDINKEILDLPTYLSIIEL